MRRVYLRPRTRLGRWSAGFLAAAFTAFALMNVAVTAGQTGGDKLSDNWWLAAPGLVAFACIEVAFILGGLALVRERERSLLVLVTVLIGAVVSVFVVGEVVSPH